MLRAKVWLYDVRKQNILSVNKSTNVILHGNEAKAAQIVKKTKNMIFSHHFDSWAAFAAQLSLKSPLQVDVLNLKYLLYLFYESNYYFRCVQFKSSQVVLAWIWSYWSERFYCSWIHIRGSAKGKNCSKLHDWKYVKPSSI